MEGLPRRVVLTGSESTGKTTLTADLARHYRAVWVPEYVRGYADWKRASLDAGDVEHIARGQIAAQDLALERAETLLLLDTDLLSTVVYAEHYYGSCPEWVRAAADHRRADLYLLCDIDVPWTPDPQRDRPGDRPGMQALFRSALAERGFPFQVIHGGWRERFLAARLAIEELVTET
jgi:HTH-type transcriptional regulator, transcriptional repressor of NAD biosynthesis genes